MQKNDFDRLEHKQLLVLDYRLKLRFIACQLFILSPGYLNLIFCFTFIDYLGKNKKCQLYNINRLRDEVFPIYFIDTTEHLVYIKLQIGVLINK